MTGHPKKLLGSLLLYGCLLLMPCSLHAQESVICDFDSGSLGNWGFAQGPINVSRIDVPLEVTHDGVAGKMIDIRTSGRSVLLSHAGPGGRDYVDCHAIRFRANVPDLETGSTFVMEFRAWHDSGPAEAHLLSKVEIESSGWQTYELPLKWFRPESDNWMTWEDAGQYGFLFRGPGRILIDTIELVHGTGEHPSTRSPADLKRIAFGDLGEVHTGTSFSVITNAPDLEPDVLLGQLEILLEDIAGDFPAVKQLDTPVCLIVFSTEEEYEQFWSRLGDQYKASVPVPRSGGYTLFDIPASYYLQQYESVRPVYLHEATHALLTRKFGLAGNGNWVQEGLASYYQTRWSGQDLFELLRPLVEQDRLGALDEICVVQQLPLNRYGEAAMLVKWLLSDPVRRPQFIEFVTEELPSRSLEIDELCRQYFEVSVNELHSEWRAWLIHELEKRKK